MDKWFYDETGLGLGEARWKAEGGCWVDEGPSLWSKQQERGELSASAGWQPWTRTLVPRIPEQRTGVPGV